MGIRPPLIASLSLLLVGCATSESTTEGLESVSRVRVLVSVPADEAEAVKTALQTHVVARMHEELPRLNLDGGDSDWTVDIRVGRETEYQPSLAAKPPDVWAVCRISLVRSVTVNGRKATAVAYQSPSHASQHVTWDPKTRRLTEELDLLEPLSFECAP